MIMFVLVTVCLLLIYKYTTRNHDYWAKWKVKHDRPLPFFGNHLRNFLVRRTNPELCTEMCNKYRGEKIVGYYRGTTPELIIRDPEIVKHILSVDFKIFFSRGGIENPVNDPLLHNILFMNFEQWRVTRPQFTSGLSRKKLRSMFPLMLKCVDKLDKTVEGYALSDKVINIFDLMTSYTLECIGSCGLNVELNTVSSCSKFANLSKDFFDVTKRQMFARVLAELLPDVASLWTPKLVDKRLEQVFLEITRRVRDERINKPIERNDFMDILLEIEAQGKFSINDSFRQSLEGNPKEKELEANLYFIAAQIFLLFIGGFETTATAMSTTLHQLAYHPEIQARIQEEIDQVLSKNGNKLTNESLEQMSQLDMAFKESMRLFSPFGSVRRVNSEKYTIPGTDVTIDPGVRVSIPIQALHKDPEYFENPEEFRPERFSTPGKPKNFIYLVFGEGPKKCVGIKLALMMAMSGLATILHRVSVTPAASSSYRLKVKKSCYLAQIVDGGLPLRFTPRK